MPRPPSRPRGKARSPVRGQAGPLPAKQPDKAPAASRRKLIEFDAETWQALVLLGRDTMKELQELVDEAIADLLRKHHRPVDLRDALRQSARLSPANDPGRKPGRRSTSKGDP